MPYEHIVQFHYAENGLSLSRDTANAPLEAFRLLRPWGPACGQLIFNLAHFLAQPEARQLYGKATRSAKAPQH
jgi:hypothetical protein